MATIPAKPTVYEGSNTSRWVGGTILAANGSAAGVHTVAIEIPAKALLLDVRVQGVTLWDSSTAGMIVGDAADDNGFFTTIDLKSGGALLAGEQVSVAAGTAMAGGVIGAYVANSQFAGGVYSTSSRVVTFTLTTTGTATTGETICLVNYLTFSGSEPIVSGSYVAS